MFLEFRRQRPFVLCERRLCVMIRLSPGTQLVHDSCGSRFHRELKTNVEMWREITQSEAASEQTISSVGAKSCKLNHTIYER